MAFGSLSCTTTFKEIGGGAGGGEGGNGGMDGGLNEASRPRSRNYRHFTHHSNDIILFSSGDLMMTDEIISPPPLEW